MQEQRAKELVQKAKRLTYDNKNAETSAHRILSKMERESDPNKLRDMAESIDDLVELTEKNSDEVNKCWCELDNADIDSDQSAIVGDYNYQANQAAEKVSDISLDAQDIINF